MRYKFHLQYKESGSQWIGRVPSHWQVMKTKRLSLVKRGASPRPIDDPKYFDADGEYSWVRIADVTASDRYLKSTTQRLSILGKSLSVPMQPGDLFLSIAGSVGKPIITKIKCCIHDGFVYFPYLSQNRDFLYYIFSSGKPYGGLGKFGTQLNLNTDIVGDIPIPVPPLPEQRAIAAFLDRETERIDTLIEKKRKQLELLQKKRVALISQAVTQGLDPKVKMKDSGVEWLGKVPEHWKISRLKFQTDRISKGTTPSTIGKEIELEGTVRFIKAENIINNTVSPNPQFFIDDETNKLIFRSCLRESDILFVIAGATIGKSAILEKKFLPANTNQAVAFIRPKPSANPSFLHFCLQSDFMQKRLWIDAVQSAQPNLSMEDLGNFFLAIPPTDEQAQIVSAVEKALDSVDRVFGKVAQSVVLLQKYRTSLISSAVTGKIDVRNEVKVPNSAT